MRGSLFSRSHDGNSSVRSTRIYVETSRISLKVRLLVSAQRSHNTCERPFYLAKMLSSQVILAQLLLAIASATPLALLTERQSQQVNIQFSVSEAQFRSFENANTLRSYIRSRGFNYDLNYGQLSQGVASVDRYFAQRAAQTTSGTDDNGFPTSGGEPQTNTDSTTLQGGPSYTNNTMSATANLVEVISFSDGNAAT